MTLYLLLALSWLLVGLTLLLLRLVGERDPERQWQCLLAAAAVPFLLFPLIRVCNLLLGQMVPLLAGLDTLWPLAAMTAGGGAMAAVRGLRLLCRERALLARCQPAEAVVAATRLHRLQALSQKAGLRRVPQLLLYPGGANVCTLGVRRPAIVLSGHLLPILDAEEFEAVLAHEVAHLRQRDYVFRWVGLLARSVLFYLPPFSIAWRVFTAAREQRADRLTVSYTGDPLAFAAALIKAWQFRPIPIGAVGLLEASGTLEARVRRLLDPTPPPRPFWRSSISAGLLIGGLLVVQVTVEGGTHTLLARLSPEVAAWEACCDPKVSVVPHCPAPRRSFLASATMVGSRLSPGATWTS